jgi:hypothetical protein
MAPTSGVCSTVSLTDLFTLSSHLASFGSTHVVQAQHRHLIGKGGQTIRGIESETGAKVYFPTTKTAPPNLRPTKEDAIVVHGTQSAVDECCDMLEERLMEVISVRSSIATRSGHEAVDSMGIPYAESGAAINGAKKTESLDHVRRA